MTDKNPLIITKEQMEKSDLTCKGLDFHLKIAKWQGREDGSTYYPEGWTAQHSWAIFLISPAWLKALERANIVPVLDFPIDWNHRQLQPMKKPENSIVNHNENKILEYYKNRQVIQ